MQEIVYGWLVGVHILSCDVKCYTIDSDQTALITPLFRYHTHLRSARPDPMSPLGEEEEEGRAWG